MYAWSPQQIGAINLETHQLEIHTIREIIAPYFSKVRGSSQFVDFDDLTNGSNEVSSTKGGSNKGGSTKGGSNEVSSNKGGSNEVGSTKGGSTKGGSTKGGSTKVMIGVVHFSEEYMPRHYFHMLVMLERDTMKLLKYSEIFYFDKIGIEFCIGFMIRDAKYHFWISKNDREPELVICSMDRLPFI